ncbi:MAG TPA: phenylalanine--tRNA ligase subunit alpha [Pirellulales bacterium]|nr:phenylalanine--tRNA ligase subunit alpha [Pirellulales bacterium]
MALADFLVELDQLQADAESAFRAAADAESLEAARIEFLGAKSGRLKAVQKGLGSVDKNDKPAAGKHFNEVKQAIDGAFRDAQERVAALPPGLILVPTSVRQPQFDYAGASILPQGTPDMQAAGRSASRGFGRLTVTRAPIDDPTLPGCRPRLGHLHPITQTIEDLKEIMGRLGFAVAEGPEIEDERHNFEALNIPAAHPARDPLENFYLSTAQTLAKAGGHAPAAAGQPPLLLRSQTSTVQIRVMETTPPPVRIISLGRVYRPDTADATHYPMFHQIEGLLVDRHVTMADLKSVLRLFAGSFFGGDVHIRFRPSFFPFTEPSVEVDMSWNDNWIEMGGAGMVDPHVLKAVGYDPEEVTGFAFGLGVERVCARRHQVTDIREFYKNDVRFLEQF